jgi:hypothetical protein
MPEIQLNGKTIATQTGTNEPVLKNNVVMESGFSIPSGVVFPAGTIIKVSHNLNDTASALLSGTATSLSLGITTQVAYSNFLIIASGNASLGSASSGRLFLTKTISATETEVGDFGNIYFNNANAVQGFTGMWNLSPSLTENAALTFKVKVAVDSGTFRYNVDWNNSNNNAQTSITVFEYM